MQVFLQMVAFSLQTDGSGLPVLTKGKRHLPGGGGGVLPYMGYIGMCRCEEYGFKTVYSSIGYIYQSVWI